jgi:hypothetical protein
VPYATPSDVHQLNTGRAFTASSKPSASEVGRFLDLTAAELDGILRTRGYLLPIPTAATSALTLMAHGNALGGAAMVEQGAPVIDLDRRDQAVRLYDDFKKMLGSASLELDDAHDAVTGSPVYGSSGSSVTTWDTEF